MEDIQLDLLIQKSTGKVCVDIDQIIVWLEQEKNKAINPERTKVFTEQIDRFKKGRETGIVNHIVSKF